MGMTLPCLVGNMSPSKCISPTRNLLREEVRCDPASKFGSDSYVERLG